MTQRTNHRQNDRIEQKLAAFGLRAVVVRISLVLVLVLLITTGGAG
ncbi:MAG: hypothetical protein JNN30_20170 [Rhodanobacteraceae bacterium]|nr:hypothetical protein [Rhodanobacteraceae bacterium]